MRPNQVILTLPWPWEDYSIGNTIQKSLQESKPVHTCWHFEHLRCFWIKWWWIQFDTKQSQASQSVVFGSETSSINCSKTRGSPGWCTYINSRKGFDKAIRWFWRDLIIRWAVYEASSLLFVFSDLFMYLYLDTSYSILYLDTFLGRISIRKLLEYLYLDAFFEKYLYLDTFQKYLEQVCFSSCNKFHTEAC